MTEKEAAVVIGASGGLGQAFVQDLQGDGYDPVISLSRSAGDFDFNSEASIEQAALQTGEKLEGCVLRRLIVSTGILHGPGGQLPERDWRHLNQDQLSQYFAVNVIGPTLVAKHFQPLLPKSSPSTCAFLSARVGSISDNRAGGWYGYRASKAALNMMVKSLAVELKRKRPQAVCVALHPGTVDTNLSRPFQKNIRAEQLFSPQQSARFLLDVLQRLNAADSGKCFAWDGREVLP